MEKLSLKESFDSLLLIQANYNEATNSRKLMYLNVLINELNGLSHVLTKYRNDMAGSCLKEIEHISNDKSEEEDKPELGQHIDIKV